MAETSSTDLQNIKGVNAITTRSGKILKEPDLLNLPNNTTATLSTSENAPPQETEKIKVNLPLLHMIKQVPSYAKVI